MKIIYEEELKKDFNGLDVEKIKKFLFFLIEKNKIMNLTTIVDFNEMLNKHIYDSLLITKVYDFNNKNVLDVGSGGGFPGIPLAIFYPKSNFVLIDSSHKKANYLKELIKVLKLKNVNIICDRVEKINGKYDIVITRALAKLNKIIFLTQHLLNENNFLITLKSKNAFHELNNSKKEMKKFNLELILIQNEKLLNGDIRINFIFKKLKYNIK